MQMRSTRAATEELCSKIDEDILQLLNKKRLMDQYLGEIEVKAITACRGAEALACLGPFERQKWMLQGSGMQMHEQALRSIMHFVRDKVGRFTHVRN